MLKKDSVAIIRYNAGNIQSVLFALERLGYQGEVTDDPEIIKKAGKVIFPGVGEASSAMQYLRSRKMDELITSLKQPVLGICLGMQLLGLHSQENNTPCLGIIPFQLFRFRDVKIPHMGWNSIYNLKGELFRALPEGSHVYHVHSYYAPVGEYTIATCNYELEYSAAVQYRNFYGVQFHTEKSAREGETILKNFLEL